MLGNFFNRVGQKEAATHSSLVWKIVQKRKGKDNGMCAIYADGEKKHCYIKIHLRTISLNDCLDFNRRIKGRSKVEWTGRESHEA